jgi:hypothetical protein
VTLLLEDIYENEGMMTLQVTEHLIGANLLSESRWVDKTNLVTGMKNALFTASKQRRVVNESPVSRRIFHVDIHTGRRVRCL